MCIPTGKKLVVGATMTSAAGQLSVDDGHRADGKRCHAAHQRRQRDQPGAVVGHGAEIGEVLDDGDVRPQQALCAGRGSAGSSMLSESMPARAMFAATSALHGVGGQARASGSR